VIFNIKKRTICYNASPKVACTTMKATLLELSGHKRTKNPEWPHVPPYITSSFRRESADFKFCLVRDPVERFVSGYSNKVLHHKAIPFVEFEDFINNFDYLYGRYGVIRHHFLPQIHFIGNDPDYYDEIYNIKNIDSLLKKLKSFLNIESIKSYKLQTGGSDKKPVPTPEQTQWIKDRYKKDYEFLEKLR